MDEHEKVEIERLFDLLPDPVIAIDAVGTLRAANSTAEETYGWSRDEWMGRSVLEFIHPDDLEWALSSMDTVMSRDIGTPIELRIRSTRGWRLIEALGRAIEVNGQQMILMSGRDLTDRRRWEVAGDDNELFRSVIHNAAGLTLLTDPEGVVRAVSGAMIRVTGHGPEATIGKSLTDLVEDHDRAHVSAAIALLDEDRRQVTVEASLRTASGVPVPCQLTVVDLADDPTVGGLIVSGHDISELWQTREQLEHLAVHDPLTGLPNRTQLRAVLERRLAPGEPARSTTVAFVDLDRFKPVNDLYGHEIGDELLVAVAKRLRHAVRDDDLVARFGGDEFVVVAPGEVAAPELLERINNALRAPFNLSVGVAHIAASVGVVEARSGDDVDTVLSEADNAMYVVKKGLGVDATTASITARRKLADRVTDAFTTQEFVVFYQPIVDLESGRWMGLEALARWRHPDRGLLAPAEFLDIVENIGLGVRLGEAVLETVCDDLRRLETATSATPAVSVNASADEMTSAEYPKMITEALRRGGIEPNRLSVEISERSILGRGGRTNTSVPANLASLADAGVEVAVDDFGTGYSSLTHLVTFPIDRIKIDRSFVAGVVTDTHRRSVIAALVGLAAATGKSVVAEGIDHPAQLEILRDLGCTLGQGFHHAPPMPYAELELAFQTELAMRGPNAQP